MPSKQLIVAPASETAIAQNEYLGTVELFNPDGTPYAPTGGVGGTAGVATVNGRAGAVSLTKTDVGLGAVPNVDATLRASHTGTQSADTIVDGVTNRVYPAADKDKLAGIAPAATANASDSSLRDRATHTGFQSADTLTDGTTNKAYTAAERTKVAGVAAGATANSTDAWLTNRANHSGTQTSASISDLAEFVQDTVAGFMQGSGVAFTYNDAGNILTVTATGGAAGGTTDPEVVRDTLGAALLGVGNITVTVNDAADTITISTTATANSTDAALRDRATHTGTQSADTIVDGTVNHAFTAAEDAKLGGIATGATANSTDAQLRDRTTHTGTQSLDTTTDSTTRLALTPAERTKLTNLSGTNSGDQTTITGNAGSATKLLNARKINGQTFDGQADVTIPASAVPFTPAGGLTSTNVAAALAELLAIVFPNYSTQKMRFVGWGAAGTLPGTVGPAGDVYFVAG